MRSVFRALIALVVFSQGSFSFEIIGSDGPTPFSRVPAPRKVSIPLQGTISSFSILENTDRVAYVDSSRVLRLYDLNTTEEIRFGGFINQLFPVSDPKGRAVLSSDLRNTKKVLGKESGQEIRLPGSTQFIGWEENELYLLKKIERLNSRTWRISYFVYNQERNQVQHRACEFDPDRNPQTLKLGSGHVFPHLVLYSEKPADGLTELNLYTLDLRMRNGQCQVEVQSQKPDLIKGKLTSVNWVSDGSYFVVISDHESANLFLGKSGSLNVASLPAGFSYIPNPRSPMIININRQKGIGVYSLTTGRYFTLELSVDRGFLEGNQIWVDARGEQLFISTKDNRDKLGGRALHTVSLKGLN
ncbi:MAG: hypothetical protein ACKN9V_02950 [Pseudomonadota bacterium]